jgi:pimeloyl-ACP methyl ester carboxylesterase
MRVTFAFCMLACSATVFPLLPARNCLAADEPATLNEQAETVEDKEQEEGSAQVNLALKTGGGIQFWTDHIHRSGFRIQQNALTGHWRLLDPANGRITWGTRETCEAALDKACPALVESDPPRHVMVLLHGLMRTRGSMKSLELKFIEASYPDVIRFSYASTRASIADHAAALRDVLEHLPANTQFSFVGHSMGNIVVRHMLGDLREDDPTNLLGRCRSMVMLGPPNQGALIAKRLARTGVFGWITGQGAIELGPKWEALEKKLATPSFPFAIIAGDLSEQPIQNPLVDGSSDLIVSVDEAKLDGAEWLKTVPVLHSFLMNSESVQQITIDFIKSH